MEVMVIMSLDMLIGDNLLLKMMLVMLMVRIFLKMLYIDNVMIDVFLRRVNLVVIMKKVR